MPSYVYRPDGDGQVVPVLVSEKVPARGTPDYMRLGFHDKILNACKVAENRGERWPADYTKSVMKRVHETARERE